MLRVFKEILVPKERLDLKEPKEFKVVRVLLVLKDSLDLELY